MPLNNIITCLWFDGQAEEAAKHYVSIFSNSSITSTHLYSEAGKENHGREPGSVMTVVFELNGRQFVALNGGPHFKFNQAISLMVECVDQAEVDYYWEKLGEGGDESQRACGWVPDKFGLSWQVIPKTLTRMLADEDRVRADRVMIAMMKMTKIEIDKLQEAYDG